MGRYPPLIEGTIYCRPVKIHCRTEFHPWTGFQVSLPSHLHDSATESPLYIAVDAQTVESATQMNSSHQIPFPSYYSEFDGDDTVYIAGTLPSNTSVAESHVGVTDSHLESALRALTGGGHFDATRFEFHQLTDHQYLLSGSSGGLVLECVPITPSEYQFETIHWTFL